MGEDKETKRTDETEIKRQDVLRSHGGKESSTGGKSAGATRRRTFLGGVVASTLSFIGLGGSASASPDSKVVAKVLEERKEFIEVLVENDILSERILRAIENSAVPSLVKRSIVTATKDKHTGFTVIRFPEASGVRLAFGDKLTDVHISLPDGIDGEAITQEMNEHVPGFSTFTHKDTCCGDTGYCNLYEEVAADRCTYYQIGAGTCGSYTCGMTACGDGHGNSILDWCCDCCGGGHSWCGDTPVCWSSTWC